MTCRAALLLIDVNFSRHVGEHVLSSPQEPKEVGSQHSSFTDEKAATCRALRCAQAHTAGKNANVLR